MSRLSRISPRPADKKKPKHKGVFFLQGVPMTTKEAFKAACAEHEATMRDVLIVLMRFYVGRKELQQDVNDKLAEEPDRRKQ